MKHNKKDSAHLLLLRKSKTEIFLVRRNDFPLWGTSGGGIEEGENPQEAAIREAIEETGFKIELKRQLAEYNIVDRVKNTVQKEYMYIGEVISGEFIPEFDGCLGKWFRVNKLPIAMSKNCKTRIREAVNHDNKDIIRKDLPESNLTHNPHLLVVMPMGKLWDLLRSFVFSILAFLTFHFWHWELSLK